MDTIEWRKNSGQRPRLSIFFEIEEGFLVELEEEEIICPLCRDDHSEKLFSPTDMEKLRLAKILVEGMGVNLAGVEVILRMRQNMIEMRNQFDTILEDLAQQLPRAFRRDF
jgi:MerR family transcriptional regulator/heat shock protein HspR